jgi:putative ABC transport system permease protein
VLVVYRQTNLIQTKNIGYNRDHILYFEKEGILEKNSGPFTAAMKDLPGVTGVSGVDRLFNGSNNITDGIIWPGKDPRRSPIFEIVTADYGMMELLGMQLKEGRSFSRQFAADTSGIIFNEAAIDQMGLKDPIGKIVKLWGKDKEIVGVVKNFHFESLHENIKPLFIQLNPAHTFYLLVKVEPGKEKEVIASLQQAYSRYNPGFTLDYRFMDQDYQALYASEQRVAILSRYFAGLAVLISCLGLFGLAAFTAQRRQKEVSIRKVVGASVSSLALMLSKDFLKLVLIAVLIAFPLAWWITHQWLQGFAYHIQPGPGLFLLAGGVTILITLFTISFQAIKAAVANPVKGLRTE